MRDRQAQTALLESFTQKFSIYREKEGIFNA